MENLGLDFKLILAQIINFALVFYIIKRFIAKPFMNFLRKEKGVQEEKAKLEFLIQAKREALEKEEKKIKEKWKDEGKIVLKKASEEAEKKRAEIIKKAQGEAGELKAKAKKQIEEEKKAADKEIRRKIVDLSIAIVERTLRDYFDESAVKEATSFIIKNYTQK